ncbi:FMN-binding protein [Paenibacillus jilunlii]|uniref:FMN-binding domain-containing protein n=1 Tax=Paenibacillus jilunlii TaxID=682956 RepID=A0A1G9FUN4_9BACL|nr:FMN-binding protein [Paenibacillus jilunlii]KWX71239.1 FMN-binding protein [Paenibacillus jilunlii]SDK92077.1 FMN-binding domain-containing protein [Paenibacillus jilunlii]
MSNLVRRKRKFKMWAIIIFIIFGVITLLILGGVLFSAPGRREIQQLTIDALDFKKLRNGTYVGQFTGTKDHFRDTKVQVTIRGGQISDIQILKGAIDKQGNPLELKRGQSIADLFGHVIQSQSLQVDVISGATLTSKAHLKALENALKQAQTE